MAKLQLLDEVGLAVNKQIIPDDPRPPLRPSAIRLGTAACVTRRMGEAELRIVAQWIVDTLRSPADANRKRIAREVRGALFGARHRGIVMLR